MKCSLTDSSGNSTHPLTIRDDAEGFEAAGGGLEVRCRLFFCRIDCSFVSDNIVYYMYYFL